MNCIHPPIQGHCSSIYPFSNFISFSSFLEHSLQHKKKQQKHAICPILTTKKIILLILHPLARNYLHSLLPLKAVCTHCLQLFSYFLLSPVQSRFAPPLTLPLSSSLMPSLLLNSMVGFQSLSCLAA